MNLIAHRGIHGNGIKENTLEAFQKAIEHEDYVGFECDVRTTKDGIFVIHHDLFEEGDLIRFCTYQELKEKYDINMLEEVLNLSTDKMILLEIKEPNLDIDAFLDLIHRYPEKHIYVFSFDNHVIQNLASKDSFAKYGVLNYVLNSEKDYSEYDFIGLLSPIITDELLDYFKNLGLIVFVYGVLNESKINPTLADVYYIVDAK